MPVVRIMERFDARDIMFQICIAVDDAPQDVQDTSSTSTPGAANLQNAFDLMRQGSRRLLNNSSKNAVATQPLPPPVYNFSNSKVQLELDVHEVFDSLGLEAPPSQHDYLRKVLKTISNFMWYIDPYHNVFRKQHGQLPGVMQHLSENVYNNYRDKKQKAPPLQASVLETHVNELFSALALPSLKLPCNVRSLDVLTELASMAAMQLAQMKKHALVMQTRREQLVVNDGKIAISIVEKKHGPFHRDLDKQIIRELRTLVCKRETDLCLSHEMTSSCVW